VSLEEKGKPTKNAERFADRYQVVRVQGKGGMATVYSVIDLTTKKKLALKRMQFQKDEEIKSIQIELFEREFHTLVQLAHPRVVEVYDYGIDETVPFYTMELLDGGDLRGLSPLPWKKACLYMRDICSALSLLHSRRLVHCDVSPRNIRCTQVSPLAIF
jgi:serine/threonine protein kinase